MENNQNPIYSQPVLDFLRVAVEYCVFLEQLGEKGTDRATFLDRVTKFLPLLYVKAALLPRLEPIGADEMPEAVTEEAYDSVQRAVWTVLRGDDEYLEVFSPDMQFSETPITANISEDLADIYQDLRNFIDVYAGRVEESMNDAVVNVADNFANYWGQKLVNALRPLHELRYAPSSDDDADLPD
jgi:hypothetical protein